MAEKVAAKKRPPRQKMPEQAPAERVKNFREVPFGYPAETARIEAARCLQCKNAPCRAGCPVEVKIPEFIQRIREGDFIGAARMIKADNALPAVCGRVCPQEDQCEKFCVLGEEGRAGRDRPARAVRGRLGTRTSGRGAADGRAADRQARRHRRGRAGRADLRRRPRPPRLSRDDLRGLP